MAVPRQLEPQVPPVAPNTVVNCASYCAGKRVADVSVPDISEALKNDGHFVWLGLYEPDEARLREIQEEFGLHDLAIEDAHSAHQRPKLEQYDNSLFVVLRTAQLNRDTKEVEFGETHIFVGPRYVVTVRHGSMISHVSLRTRCEATPDLLAMGPGFVLYMLMDFIVDQYFPVVDALELELEELEKLIFETRDSRDTTSRVYDLKRNLLAIRRATAPVVDMCNRLMRFDYDLVPDATRPYFRDVYDHAVRITEMVDTLRELVTTALEAHLSLIAVSQNEDTKRLAAWAAIIGVPTMIAGIYGMNFANIPELHWQYGYYFALASMVVACGALFAGFKRSGWL
ncbi:MAG: magnesium/cobalt transporter CorA [Vicinamibacterales bacterium]